MRIELLRDRFDPSPGLVGRLSRSTEPGVVGLRPATDVLALNKANKLRKGEKVEIYGGASPVDTLDRETLIRMLQSPATPWMRYYPGLDVWVDTRTAVA